MMILVPELHNLETTFVDIEMNISFLEIGRDGFPYFYFRVYCFNGKPCGLTNSLAVCFGGNEKQLQFTFGFFGI